MDPTTRDGRLSPRARRALSLIVAAVLVAAWASVAYLQPSLLKLPQPAAPVRAAGPAVLSFDYMASYSFVTATLGWALVGNQSGVPQFSVFKTIDGAKHWKRLFVRQINAAGVNPLQVWFFDRDHGVIAAGDPPQIYRTSDGGTHWALVRSPAESHASFFAADVLHAWFLGWSDPLDRGAPMLFSTADRGDTWAAIGPVPVWTLTPDGGYANFAFRATGEGWFGTSAAKPTVYSSFDGGASWQPHALPSNPAWNVCTGGKPLPPGAQSQLLSDVSLLPGHGVVAILSDYCGNGAGYTSFDGGVTWRPVASPPGTTNFWNYVYQDSSHWWAMGFGVLWKSSDAGRTWKLASRQLDNWDYLPHVIDANHAWAELYSSSPAQAPGAGLALTSDSGLHWVQVSAPLPG